MPTYGSVLTVIGAAQIANSQITGVAPVWTAMGVGDGGGHVVTPSAERTALVREVYRGQINTLYRAGDDETQIVAELVIQPQTGGWTLREVGIYDADGNLVVYGSLPEMVKPVLERDAEDRSKHSDRDAEVRGRLSEKISAAGRRHADRQSERQRSGLQPVQSRRGGTHCRSWRQSVRERRFAVSLRQRLQFGRPEFAQ